jgi:hypothetical protein
MMSNTSKKFFITLGGIITFSGVVFALLNDAFNLFDRFAPTTTPSTVVQSEKLPDDDANIFFSTFPLYIGNQWNYTYSLSTPDMSVPANPIKTIGTFSEKVAMVSTGYQDSVRIFTIEQQGEAISPYCYGWGDAPKSRTYWIVANEERVFVVCDEKEVSDLAINLRLLIDPRYTPIPDLSIPTYYLPLEAGKLWPSFLDLPKRDDTAYQWHVDSKLNISL